MPSAVPGSDGMPQRTGAGGQVRRVLPCAGAKVEEDAHAEGEAGRGSQGRVGVRPAAYPERVRTAEINRHPAVKQAWRGTVQLVEGRSPATASRGTHAAAAVRGGGRRSTRSVGMRGKQQRRYSEWSGIKPAIVLIEVPPVLPPACPHQTMNASEGGEAGRNTRAQPARCQTKAQRQTTAKAR